MPNTPVRAAAEGMPNFTRRKMLTGIAASSAMSFPAAAAQHDASLADVEALVAKHAQLVAAEFAAYDAVPDISHVKLPRARVKVGKKLIEKNDDGEDCFEPVWAYSEPEIIEAYTRIQGSMSAVLRDPAKLAVQTDRWEAAKQEKLAEFRAVAAEKERLLVESGYRPAEDAAVALGWQRHQMELTIVAYRPTSLAAAVRLCAWAAAGSDDTYWLDEKETKQLLLSIASAGDVA